MAAINKLKWKRLLNELSFLHEENDFVETIIMEFNKSFIDYYEEFCERHELDIDQLNKDNHPKIQELYSDDTPSPATEEQEPDSEDNQLAKFVAGDEKEEPKETEYEMSQDELEMHEAFAKLFRALALKLHPDKLSSSLTTEERDDMINMFYKAKDALKDRKYFILLEMAERFNIKTPRNYKQQTRWMKKEVETMKEHLNKRKGTYNYAFSECETVQEKDNLVKKFIKQLFNVNI
jgi:hypothetical protein